jgi:hypothetical protein
MSPGPERWRKRPHFSPISNNNDDDDKKDEPDQDGVDLGWKDYLALFIAFVETIALPLVVLIVILLFALFILGILR